ncbi:hypothetical protein EC396_09425 [Lutibacter sp. HS1-25]|uniref:hypothetical protein n=1 Tax=Lutibacter sp. HS1-25 TaxID=2485000 RepID=UPI001011494F|nr:hypothetical protein [Lutibacter sp. HS1-25]RXP54274.1 hypothetical protein EC396_09425 [Lutibacter sp. HS1-25]
MKKTLTILAILISFSFGLQAQNTSKKIRPHKVWITLMDQSKVKGVLYSADDESIKISENNSLDISNLTTVSGEQINTLKIRRKGKIGKSIWIGAVSGVGTGVILGLATESDGWEGVVATGAGFTLGVVGTGIGAGVGAIKKRININGNMDTYKTYSNEIQSYSLVIKK